MTTSTTTQLTADDLRLSKTDLIGRFADVASLPDIQKRYKDLISYYHPSKFEDDESKALSMQLCDVLTEILDDFQTGKIQQGKPQAPPITNLPNYSKHRDELTLGHWKDYWDVNQSYGQNVRSLIDRFVKLPDSTIQLPIVAGFACQNLPLLHKSNLLCCYGGEGSGKSTLAKLLGCLSGAYQSKAIIQASSTFASIRNYIDGERFMYTSNIPGATPIERNLVLVWDDLTPKVITDERIYNLLKSYDRATAYIKLAGQGEEQGQTVSFFVFSLKVISSVTPFFAHSQFRELTRRTLYIKCKRASISDDIEIPQIEDVDWTDLEHQFYLAWSEGAIASYKQALQGLRKPKSVNHAQWEISRALLASGVALGVWDTTRSALNDLKDYWSYFEDEQAGHKSPTELALESIIEEWRNDPVNQQEGKVDELCMKYVKFSLAARHKRGELDNTPTAKRIHETMQLLGWKVRQSGRINVYVPMD